MRRHLVGPVTQLAQGLIDAILGHGLFRPNHAWEQVLAMAGQLAQILDHRQHLPGEWHPVRPPHLHPLGRDVRRADGRARAHRRQASWRPPDGRHHVHRRRDGRSRAVQSAVMSAPEGRSSRDRPILSDHIVPPGHLRQVSASFTSWQSVRSHPYSRRSDGGTIRLRNGTGANMEYGPVDFSTALRACGPSWQTSPRHPRRAARHQ